MVRESVRLAEARNAPLLARSPELLREMCSAHWVLRRELTCIPQQLAYFSTRSQQFASLAAARLQTRSASRPIRCTSQAPPVPQALPGGCRLLRFSECESRRDWLGVFFLGWLCRRRGRWVCGDRG